MSKEAVNHPDHYNKGGIEVIEYIKSALGVDGCYNFCMGNAIKYISRAKHKGKQVEDLKKAIWYIDYAIGLVLGSELKKADEDRQDSTGTTPYIPNITITTSDSPWTTTTTGCATCPNNPKNMLENYIGDWPCQWCSHNPMRITCDSDINTIK